MNEPVFPVAWGLWYAHGLGDFYGTWLIFLDQDEAYAKSQESELVTAVELIPAQEVERRIAAAVAAERQRCRLLCVQRYDHYRAISPQYDNETYRGNRDCAEALEAAIESGIEPGKGGG
jgi:hypothetical protein